MDFLKIVKFFSPLQADFRSVEELKNAGKLLSAFFLFPVFVVLFG